MDVENRTIHVCIGSLVVIANLPKRIVFRLNTVSTILKMKFPDFSKTVRIPQADFYERNFFSIKIKLLCMNNHAGQRKMPKNNQ